MTIERDYLAEMRALVAAETAEGPYVSALVAEQIVTKLRATDSDLLNGWLHASAVAMLRHTINLRDCSTRTQARHNAQRSAFQRDASRFAAGGDAAVLAGWMGVVHVMEDGTRKRLATMTAADLTFVATDYEARANENLMHAAFLRAVAKKIGRRSVQDVFDETKLNRLWQSLNPGLAAA